MGRHFNRNRQRVCGRLRSEERESNRSRYHQADCHGICRSREVSRGKHWCNDCHTPWTMGPQGPAPDMSRMLSGHPANAVVTAPAKVGNPWMWAGDNTMTAFSGPWGVSFAMNLTPDSLTGIGSWSQETFMNAIRTGKHMGTGRPILPPMPWFDFKNLTDADLSSVYMYLMTIPKIANQVAPPIMPPGGMPPGMGGPPPGQPAPPPPAK